MPLIGLGTFTNKDAAHEMSKAITEIGYRSIDTASRYSNEEVVGECIKLAIESGKVKREELFITTKLWIDEVEDVEAACKSSLKRLGLDYVDLYLVHWPVAVKTVKPASESGEAVYERMRMPMHKVWPQMEALVAKGLAKSIGVSNFNVQLLWDLLSYCQIKPAAN